MKPSYGLTRKAMRKVDLYVDDVEEHIRQLEHAIRIYEEASERFLYAVFMRAQEMLEDRGSSAEGVDYSKLKFVDVGRLEGFNTMALVHPELTRGLGAGDANATLVYVQPKRTNDQELEMLSRMSPWPPEVLKGPIDPADARVISRRVTKAEVVANVERLFKDDEAKAYMIEGGAISKTKTLDEQKKEALDAALAPGWEVEEDIAWRVLRQEYGLGEEMSIVHWRPTLKVVTEEMQGEAEAFMMYLLGDDEALDRTKIDGKGVGGIGMSRILWFQQNLGHIGKASRAGEVPT